MGEIGDRDRRRALWWCQGGDRHDEHVELARDLFLDAPLRLPAPQTVVEHGERGARARRMWLRASETRETEMLYLATVIWLAATCGMLLSCSGCSVDSSAVPAEDGT